MSDAPPGPKLFHVTKHNKTTNLKYNWVMVFVQNWVMSNTAICKYSGEHVRTVGGRRTNPKLPAEVVVSFFAAPQTELGPRGLGIESTHSQAQPDVHQSAGRYPRLRNSASGPEIDIFPTRVRPTSGPEDRFRPGSTIA